MMDPLPRPPDETPTQDAAAPRAPESREARQAVWTLAGGKGGVGRSLLAANLGVQLARAGRRVVLVDLDLQGGNLHTYLGFQRLSRSLEDLASGRVSLLSELACETPTGQLRLVGGLQKATVRDDPVAFVRQVAEQFPTLSADHVIVDCGSGRAAATVAAFAEGTIGILVTTPEPAAIESTYLFAEAHLRWCLVRALPAEAMASVQGRLRDLGLDVDRASFRVFMTRLASVDAPAREAIVSVVRGTRLELVLNQVRGEADEEAAASLASGFRKCFGLNLQTAGLIEHDLSVLQSIQKRRPLSQQYPNASSTKAIARAATRLLAVSVTPPREPDEEWDDFESIDHYRVLEVVPKASPKEVQSSYQLLKRTYDPETTFLAPVLEAPALRDLQARIEAAYRTLIFLESRASYDRQMLERGALRAEDVRGLHAEPSAPAPAAPPESSSPPAAADVVIEAVAAVPGATEAPPRTAQAAAPATVPVTTHPGTPDETTPAPTSDPPRTPASGAEIRDLRQRLSLSLEAIAERTKVRPIHLQAIEEERFGDLPAAVFVRGFLKAYARCLGCSGDEVTRLYMKRYQDWIESRDQPPILPITRATS
jgi:flagellar biosynthesis protein FlhG